MPTPPLPPPHQRHQKDGCAGNYIGIVGLRFNPSPVGNDFQWIYNVYTHFALSNFTELWLMPGGGGGTPICMHIGYVPRERPPFSALNFRSGAYHFHKFPKKNPFRSITILHFLADFAVPETIIFKISLISTRSSPPTAGSARTQRRGLARRVLAVPESPISTLKTDQARSGAPPPPHFQARSGGPHFHARPGARSGALAYFSLCRGTYLPKFGVSNPPPPPPG